MFGYVLRSKEQDEAYRNGFAAEFDKQWNELENLYREHTQALEKQVALRDRLIARQKEVINMQRELIELLKELNKKLTESSNASN